MNISIGVVLNTIHPIIAETSGNEEIFQRILLQ